LKTQRLPRLLIVTHAVYPHLVVNYDLRQTNRQKEIKTLYIKKTFDRK